MLINTGRFAPLVSAWTFVVLKPAEDRASRELKAAAVVQALNGQFFGQIQEAIVAIFPPPPVQGLGTVGGFKLYVEDRAGRGFEDLYAQVQSSMAKAQQARGTRD